MQRYTKVHSLSFNTGLALIPLSLKEEQAQIYMKVNIAHDSGHICLFSHVPHAYLFFLYMYRSCRPPKDFGRYRRLVPCEARADSILKEPQLLLAWDQGGINLYQHSVKLC